MKLKKLAALLIALCAFCVLGGGLNAPAFADGTQTLTLNLLSGGYTTSQATTDYILSIPDSFDVKQKGWNDIGKIAVTVSNDLMFSTDKKVVVTAASTNSFNLSDGTNTIGYTLTTTEGGTQTTDFSFSAEDITAGTASQDLGISINWDSSQAAGTYTDTITYTGEVKSALQVSIYDFSDNNGNSVFDYNNGWTWQDMITNYPTSFSEDSGTVKITVNGTAFSLYDKNSNEQAPSNAVSADGEYWYDSGEYDDVPDDDPPDDL
ncbi:MAG: hypothetical protein IJS39_17720 [Synergistaceae bacterium]|nr:hypothetical protein [Synergistaceae bacterium]